MREWALVKGWLDPENPRCEWELCALIGTEIAEAVEAIRAGNPPADKPGLEGMTNLEEEVADIAIRLIQSADELGKPIHIHGSLGAPSRVTGSLVGQLGVISESVSRGNYSYAMSQLAHWCEEQGIDLAEAIDRKMAVNQSRPYRHGGKLA